MTVATHNNTKGLVRAFDVRTGKQLWRFNTIPRPGEFGNDTWEENSWSFNGNTGVWTQISVDEELGLAYLPIETPTSDFYGGHRPGNNLFAESLVAVDLKTGVSASGTSSWCTIRSGTSTTAARRSSPTSRSTASPGRSSRSRASRRGSTCSIARPAQPIWPIEERPVPQSDVPGEKTSPTQPHPTKPPAVRAQLLAGARRSDRLHAGAAAAGARGVEALQVRADAVQPADPRQRERTAARRASVPAPRPTGRASAYDPETAHRLRAGRQRARFRRDRWSSRRRASPTSAT